MAASYLGSWRLSVLALLLLRLAVARAQTIEWSVEGVARYIGTTLNVSFGDTLTFVCQNGSYSNVIIQPDRAQFDACDSRVTNGSAQSVVECIGVTLPVLFDIRRNSNLPSTIQLVEGEDFYFTSYSDGTPGSQLNDVTHGGECLMGLKLAMRVNVQMTTDATDPTDATDGTSNDGTPTPSGTSNGIPTPDPTTVATVVATVTSFPPTTSSGGLESSVSTMAIVGIIVGVVGGAGFVVCCIVIVCVRCYLKKRGESKKVTPSAVSLADGQGNCEKGQDGVQLKVVSHLQNGSLPSAPPRERATSPNATQGKTSTPPKQDQINAPAKQTISTREKSIPSPRALRRKPPTPPAANQHSNTNNEPQVTTNLTKPPVALGQSKAPHTKPDPTQRHKVLVAPSNLQERRSSPSPLREEDRFKMQAGKSGTPLRDSNARQSPKPVPSNQRTAPKATIPQKPVPPPHKPSLNGRGPRVTRAGQDSVTSRSGPLKPLHPPNATVGVTSLK